MLPAKDLADRRPRHADLALAGSRILGFFYTIRESDGLPDAGAHLINRLLVVLVLGRRLSGEPSRPGLDIIASTLDLVDERLHVGREAGGHQDADIELLGGRVLLSAGEPTLEILQHLRALRNHLVIHRVVPFV